MVSYGFKVVRNGFRPSAVAFHMLPYQDLAEKHIFNKQARESAPFTKRSISRGQRMEAD